MTTATWNPATPTTITLPQGKWDTIRVAVLSLACEEQIKGNYRDADHYLAAYDALKEAMGM
jgi:hypothetical protein